VLLDGQLAEVSEELELLRESSSLEVDDLPEEDDEDDPPPPPPLQERTRRLK